jgi:hypothetical protein
VSHLRAAAGADDPTTEIESAIDVADKAKSDIEALTPPSDVSGSQSSAIINNLIVSKNYAADRWSAISDQLAMIEDPSGKTVSDLSSSDDTASSSREKSSSTLQKALSLSAAK